MSAKSVESILSRAMSDANFAELLLSNPDQALAGYDLIAEETAKFRGMSRADFAKWAAASPEERKSFGVIVDH
jgi:acetyl-CoA acetyltransferase